MEIQLGILHVSHRMRFNYTEYAALGASVISRENRELHVLEGHPSGTDPPCDTVA